MVNLLDLSLEHLRLRPQRPLTDIEHFARLDPVADLQVLYAGFQACAPGHRWSGRRTHALVHHVLSGRGHVRSKGRVHSVGPGDSFLFFPEEEMNYTADRSDPWRYLWVGIGGTRVVHWLETCGLGPSQPVLPSDLHRHPEAPLIAILNTLDAASQGAPLQPARLQAHLFELLAQLSQPRQNPRLPPERPYIGEILGFLDRAYSRPLTTEKIARFVGLERTYCCQLFSKSQGQSLMAYLTKLRMEKALALLHGTSMTVQEVAQSVGYPDAGVFAKRFRALQGLSPTEARSSEA